MRIPTKVQFAPFDVADWEVDAEFGVFPQGARAKDAVFVPSPPPEPVLLPGRRYLFKRSKRSYPDQFWGEIVAYRIGCLMGVEVPPAFAAWNSQTGICAALIEWFYVDRAQAFLLAGDFLQQIQDDFDRDKGEQHNMKDNVLFLRVFAQNKLLHQDWRRWWVDALLFDTLIGNTDRHQDNWGVVLDARTKTFRLSPLFDNGTSLGHERFPDRVAHWSDEDMDRYIRKGHHHLRWSLAEPQLRGHFDLLERALEEWPETRTIAQSRLDFSAGELTEAIADLTELALPVRLLPERMRFMLRLLQRRHQLLQSLLS